jgi:hypothetical protein
MAIDILYVARKRNCKDQTMSVNESAEAQATELAVLEGPTAKVGGVDAEMLSPADQAALLEQLSSDELARFYLSNELEGKRVYQRSQELFEKGVAIVNVQEELLLKKATERVRFKKPPKLLQRQLHNVLLFVARPYLATQDVFEVSLEYLTWAVEHKVNGYGYLKESLEEMQQCLMQITFNGHWFSTQILQDVNISPDNILSFRLPPVLRKLYAAPQRYYHVSMKMNARFRSKYAHALYELLMENRSFRKDTGFMTVEEFRERMGIAPGEYTEYKRLAARVLTPALKELEELGDYYAEVEYRHEARKVVGLKFHIKENTKNALPFEVSLDPDTFAVLREEFGLNQKQITELTQTHDVKRISEVADVLFYRYIVRKKSVRNGFRLVQNALNDTEDNYFLTNTEKTELQAIKARRKQEVQLAQARIESQTKLVGRFDAWWASLTEADRLTTWDRFLDEPESVLVRQSRKGKKGALPDLGSQFVKAGLVSFVSRTGELPEQPSVGAVASAQVGVQGILL